MSRLFPLSLCFLALAACFPEDSDPPTDTDTAECRTEEDPDVLMWMPLEDCVASLVGCDAGGDYFEDDCGCGCLVEDDDTDAPDDTDVPDDTDAPDDTCLTADDPGVSMYMPLAQCLAAALVGCDTGGEYFEDACGCGCYEDPA